METNTERKSRGQRCLRSTVLFPPFRPVLGIWFRPPPRPGLTVVALPYPPRTSSVCRLPSFRSLLCPWPVPTLIAPFLPAPPPADASSWAPPSNGHPRSAFLP
ncbi:hypothetical protein CRG98_023052 [Punica granatum]|uniref:Uncharacterized protein n=1 Tax=Punica granatum TaxID=22663 RepID=A0A2I0JLX7_PUNGR|nr:hypothetical protein CRG98_023052 [Punica granatum]